MKRVLVVDDDPTVSEVVAGYLGRAGFHVERAADGPSAVALAAARPPDLMVLDLMLPGMDGLEVCRRVREDGPLPVIMLTARGDEEDRVLGLEVGADDYVTKPFSPRELVLRVESVLRRAGSHAAVRAEPVAPWLRSGPLALEPTARRAIRDGVELALTIREFDLLEFFLRHPGRATSREELMRQVWGWEFGDLSTVTVHVRRLREKIEDDPARPRLISTVWGIGYRFDAPPSGEPDEPGRVGTAGETESTDEGEPSMLADALLIALYAAVGAGACGVAGAVALRLLRHRSVTLSLAVVAAVTVAAMLAGTMLVSWAMFLSDHDLWVVTTVCAMAAVVSLVVALLLGRSVVRGSRDLAEATRALGDDGNFVPPSVAPTAELASLSRQLAATSERLAASRERERALEASRRELVAWISHDLRTPLAGLQAMTEALEDGMVQDPRLYHTRIRTEVERMSGMVSDLFELSRIQAGVLALSPTRMSAYDLVGDAMAGADALAREHGVRLVGDRVDQVPIEVDGREMSRVLANLLVNAIRRTPVDGKVAVSARREADRVVLAVTDGCGGIPPEDLPRVFDTGWRGTDARTPPAGAGLGLAIVRGIVEAHQGSAAVWNVPGGCRFEVHLPAAV